MAAMLAEAVCASGGARELIDSLEKDLHREMGPSGPTPPAATPRPQGMRLRDGLSALYSACLH
jgi:hypothetical protein